MDIEDVRRQFNKYHLTDMLHKLNELSVEIINSLEDMENLFINVKRITYTYLTLDNKLKKQSYLLTNWTVVDVAYFVSKYSSPAFSKTKFNENDFLKIIHDYIIYMPIQKFENHDDFKLSLYGFTGEQFKFQTPSKVKENYSRENYILNKYYDVDKMDEIVNKLIGVSAKKLSVILLFLFGAYTSKKDVFNLKPNFGDITFEDICKVMKYYSVKLEDIADSNLGRQVFYVKPFIEESEGVFFPVNSYLIYQIFQNSNLWIIRDYFNTHKSEEFIHLFGTMFEYYVEHLIKRYIDEQNFCRIITGKKKSADYKIELGDYKIIVEAKSALLGLQARQQDSDIKTIKRYINEHIVKAIHQLNNSEEFYNDGKYIKIILVYEDYFKSELLEEVFKTIEDVENDRLFWLVNISEFENLLYLYENQNELFIEIMDEKILCEKEKSLYGRDFAQLFERKEIKENFHIKQEEYKRFYNEVVDTIRTNLG